MFKKVSKIPRRVLLTKKTSDHPFPSQHSIKEQKFEYSMKRPIYSLIFREKTTTCGLKKR